jgi:hypothetical protein
MIYMVKEQYPEAVTTYLDPILSAWMPGLAECIKLETNMSTLAIKNEALRVE